MNETDTDNRGNQHDTTIGSDVNNQEPREEYSGDKESQAHTDLDSPAVDINKQSIEYDRQFEQQVQRVIDTFGSSNYPPANQGNHLTLTDLNVLSNKTDSEDERDRVRSDVTISNPPGLQRSKSLQSGICFPVGRRR